MLVMLTKVSQCIFVMTFLQEVVLMLHTYYPFTEPVYDPCWSMLALCGIVAYQKLKVLKLKMDTKKISQDYMAFTKFSRLYCPY